jgi:hypothetical protein
MVITSPNEIQLFRLLTLRSGLKLEIRGLKVSKGRSCFAIIKQEFGLTGSREEVLEQFNEMLGTTKGETT